MFQNFVNQLSQGIDRFSSFLARYRGLPTMIAIALVLLNFCVHFLPLGWFSESNLLLHVGIVIGFLGLLLAEVVGKL